MVLFALRTPASCVGSSVLRDEHGFEMQSPATFPASGRPSP
jgi:hypothetical protein